MTLETLTWDSASLLRTSEDVAAYLEAVLEDGDPALLEHAFAAIARSQAMAEIARKSEVGLDSLKEALRAARKQDFGSIVKALDALGFRLSLVTRGSSEDQALAASS